MIWIPILLVLACMAVVFGIRATACFVLLSVVGIVGFLGYIVYDGSRSHQPVLTQQQAVIEADKKRVMANAQIAAAKAELCRRGEVKYC